MTVEVAMDRTSDFLYEGRVKPAPFDYHAPTSAAEAVALLAELQDDAKVIAGGQSLVPLLALRLTTVGHLIDLNGVEGLSDAEHRPGSVVVGAMVRHRALIDDEKLRSSIPLLARAAPFIGHFQIRNRGTLGGSLAHADPAAELPAVALALSATIHVLSIRGRRCVPAQEFFSSMFTTALDADEMLEAVEFPVWSGRTGFSVHELSRRAGDFAIAGVACGVKLDDVGRIDHATFGLFGMASTPVSPHDVIEELRGHTPSEVDARELGMLAVRDLEPPDDIHATSAARRRIGAALVGRAFTDAISEATRA
jgi:aerobic carbon-monoxide dehydrogenase medium subunit